MSPCSLLACQWCWQSSLKLTDAQSPSIWPRKHPGLNFYPGSGIKVVAIFSLVLFACLDVWLFESLTLWMFGSLAPWMWQSYPKIGVVCPAATHPILADFHFLVGIRYSYKTWELCGNFPFACYWAISGNCFPTWYGLKPDWPQPSIKEYGWTLGSWTGQNTLKGQKELEDLSLFTKRSEPCHLGWI